MDVVVVDHVIVLEDQDQIVERAADLVQYGDRDLLDPLITPPGDQTADVDARRRRVAGERAIERSGNVAPEADRVVVVGVERQPRHR